MKKLCPAAFSATTLLAMATPGDALKGWDKNTDSSLDKTELSTAITELDTVAPDAGNEKEEGQLIPKLPLS